MSTNTAKTLSSGVLLRLEGMLPILTLAENTLTSQFGLSSRSNRMGGVVLIVIGVVR